MVLYIFIGKNLHLSGSAQFKPVLFAVGELYAVSTRETKLSSFYLWTLKSLEIRKLKIREFYLEVHLNSMEGAILLCLTIMNWKQYIAFKAYQL